MKRSKYYAQPGVLPGAQNKPQHVAIIMDGNGRWARSQKFSHTKGHQKGVATAKDIIMACCEKQIPILTLFAFGMENWRRPPKEIRNIFRILFLILKKDITTLHEKGIKLRVMGDRTPFPPILLNAIEAAEKRTENNDKLILNLAVNFSGRWDILQAVQKIVQEYTQKPLLVDQIDEGLLSQTMSFQGLPEPDLFIRTGGVQRLSNFVLWDLAYSELYFTETLWPDFTLADFDAALQAFAQRERRFGLTGEQLQS